MKILAQNKVYEVASAALRCGRYANVLRKKKNLDKYEIGYHDGKLYAYTWILLQLGLCEFLEKDKVFQIKNFLKTYRKGRIILYPKLKWGFMILIKEKFFEDVLEYMLPVHGIETTNAIRKLCTKV